MEIAYEGGGGGVCFAEDWMGMRKRGETRSN